MQAIKTLNEKYQGVNLQKLSVPQHLLCFISRDIMEDPVTIESGYTYERENIKTYFDIQRQKAINSDIDNEISVSDLMVCPLTQIKVDPNIMIPNTAIKKATEKFIDENAWAFYFDPKEKYEDIIIWDQQFY